MGRETFLELWKPSAKNFQKCRSTWVIQSNGKQRPDSMQFLIAILKVPSANIDQSNTLQSCLLEFFTRK